MRYYIKDNIIKLSHQIIIEKDDKIITNPSEDVLLENGWDIYVKPDPTIEEIKKSVLNKIKNHDKSQEVNSFFIGETQAWIDRDTRVSLMNSTNILKSMGQETTTLWLNNQSYTLSCELVIQMLGALEVYALQCYNTTAQHKANITNLNTKEEVEAYDFKTGYPEKLVFNV